MDRIRRSKRLEQKEKKKKEMKSASSESMVSEPFRRLLHSSSKREEELIETIRSFNDEEFLEVWRCCSVDPGPVDPKKASDLMNPLANEVIRRGMYNLIISKPSESPVLSKEDMNAAFRGNAEGHTVAVAIDASGSMGGDAQQIKSILEGRIMRADHFTCYGADQGSLYNARNFEIGDIVPTRIYRSRYTFHRCFGVDRRTILKAIQKEGSSGFCTRTYPHHIFWITSKLCEQQDPYVLVLIGDGAFNDYMTFERILNQEAANFSNCSTVVFLPINVNQGDERAMDDMFTRFAESSMEGGITYKRVGSVTELEEYIQSIRGTGGRKNGYSIIQDGLEGIMVARVHKFILADSLSKAPEDLRESIGRFIIQIASDPSQARRLNTDPVFSSLYASIIILSKRNDDDMAEWAQGVVTELSKIVSRVQRESRHYHILQDLIDSSKRDPLFANKMFSQHKEILDRLQKEGKESSFKTIRYKGKSKIDTKKLIREFISGSLMYEQVPLFFKGLVVEEGSSGGDPNALEFVMEDKESVNSVVKVLLRLCGVEDVTLSPKFVLMAAFFAIYEIGVAFDRRKKGLHPQVFDMFKTFISNFDRYDLLGLDWNSDTGEWDLREIPEIMLHPVLMRWMVRSFGRFNFYPCKEAQQTLRSLLKYKALLMLFNAESAREVGLDIPVQVPPASDRPVGVMRGTTKPVEEIPSEWTHVMETLREGSYLTEEIAGIQLRLHPYNPDFQTSDVEILSLPSLLHDATMTSILRKNATESWEEFWTRTKSIRRQLLERQIRSVVHWRSQQDVLESIMNHSHGVPFARLVEFPEEAVDTYPRGMCFVGPSNKFLSAFLNGDMEEVLVDDVVHVKLNWKNLMSDRILCASLGISPHVARDIQAINGTKMGIREVIPISYSEKEPWERPPVGKHIEIQLNKKMHSSVHNHQVVNKPSIEVLVGDEFWEVIRRTFWKNMERFMRLQFTLDESTSNKLCTCFLCFTDYEVNLDHMWFPLDCCGQSMCTNCATEFLALPDTGHIKPWPGCPCCRTPITNSQLKHAGVLEEYQTLRKPFEDLDQSLETLDRENLFSRCGECHRGIATKRECSLNLEDLPSVCEECFIKSFDGTKPCPTCGVLVHRNGGCSDIKCTMCENHMCWVCGGHVEFGHDVNHFVDGFFANTCVNT